MTTLVDLLMSFLGIATWQKKGRQAYPPLFKKRKARRQAERRAAAQKTRRKHPVQPAHQTHHARHAHPAQKRPAKLGRHAIKGAL